MVAGEVRQISLTGPGSHLVRTSPGQGSVSIGPREGSRREPELVVDPDEVLNWSAFDPFTVPAGYPWPRVFTYRGIDTGFLDWSRRRHIESFSWSPTAPVGVDASDAGIDRFFVELRDAPVSIVLPHRLVEFTCSGDLSLLRAEWSGPTTCPGLYFYPQTHPSARAEPLRLPDLPSLQAVRDVFVKVSPVRQPLDCASLLQFPHLTRVRLVGNLANLEVLGRFPELRQMQLGDCPHLDELPTPSTWPHLNDFSANGIEQGAGKRLRRHFKAYPIDRVSITGLRPPGWFDQHHGLPFGDWLPVAARKVTKAFQAAETADDPEAGIRQFVRFINTLPGIDTIEREDAGEAVALLASRRAIDRDRALEWFDEERDF
jgi:hypothetical protein